VQLPSWTGFHCLARAFHSQHPIHALQLTRPAFDSTPRPHLIYQHTICQFIACSSYVKQASSYPDLSYLLISVEHRQLRLHLFSVYLDSLSLSARAASSGQASIFIIVPSSYHFPVFSSTSSTTLLGRLCRHGSLRHWVYPSVQGECRWTCHLVHVHRSRLDVHSHPRSRVSSQESPSTLSSNSKCSLVNRGRRLSSCLLDAMHVRLHYEWVLPLLNGVLDHEHLPATRNRIISSCQQPTVVHLAHAKEVRPSCRPGAETSATSTWYPQISGPSILLPYEPNGCCDRVGDDCAGTLILFSH
jgi:hypothetical protein